jgi:hypothetical protein
MFWPIGISTTRIDSSEVVNAWMRMLYPMVTKIIYDVHHFSFCMASVVTWRWKE